MLARLGLLLAAFSGFASSAYGQPADSVTNPRLKKRWLFIRGNMRDPKQVDTMIARFAPAAAAGYNGIVLPYDVAPDKAGELTQAAKKQGLDLIATVMGGAHDRNYTEGVFVQDALFVVHGPRALFQPDNPLRLVNADFEESNGNHFKGWGFQDDEGVTTFADHDVAHGGKTSLRMENIGRNQNRHCRLMQPVKLQAHRQYRLSFWVKTEKLAPADAEVKVLAPGAGRAISFETFHVEGTQDWKRYNLVFNSLEYHEGLLYLGSWSGNQGKLWWDDLQIEEIALVNVLRRPGCPVTVRAENGTLWDEGRDYNRIVDPVLNPWQPYHEPPLLKLAPGSRIPDGARLRVSYYHPIIVYEDSVTSCVSEPKIFEDWREEITRANDLFHPAAFFMSHDEMRVMNQCALCQSKHLTPGELLAENVRQSARIIRDIRPDAEIWVWNDMFDPMHNAVDHYYAVNGSLAGSWKGLDSGIGIVNWHGGLKGKNCKFFADLGLRQILAGYYDGDEDGAAIVEWRHNTENVPGIVGVMYTTWQDKYGAMNAWAARAFKP